MPERYEATIDEFADELAQQAAPAPDDGEAGEGGTPAGLPTPQSLDDIRLDGDNVPELVRGKTASEAMRALDAMQTSLKASEEARRQAEQSYRQQGYQQQQQNQQGSYNREQMRELFEQDPVAAIEQMGGYLAQQLDTSLNTRLQPLTSGISSTAEAHARQQYAEDFELFGDQINQVVARLPDRSVLANKQSWDDLVSYVRGQPGNFDRIVDQRMQKQRETEAVAAREREQVTSGYAGRPRPSGQSADAGGGELDAVQKKMAQEFIGAGVFKNEQEYKKWMKQ